MGLLDSLFQSFSGQRTAGVAPTLLNLLAPERGQGAGAGPTDEAFPAAISGGLNELVQRFQQNGFGDVINSWIGSGSKSADVAR